MPQQLLRIMERGCYWLGSDCKHLVCHLVLHRGNSTVCCDGGRQCSSHSVRHFFNLGIENYNMEIDLDDKMYKLGWGTQFVLLPGNVTNLCPKSHLRFLGHAALLCIIDTSIEKQNSSEKNKINM